MGKILRHCITYDHEAGTVTEQTVSVADPTMFEDAEVAAVATNAQILAEGPGDLGVDAEAFAHGDNNNPCPCVPARGRK